MARPADRLAPMLLSRDDVARCLHLDDCITAVEAAFRAHGEGSVPPPAIASVSTPTGSFHVKAGLFGTSRSYFAAKLNANFPDNRRLGLPTIQGVMALCDAASGSLLALMDSIEITALRTGAATAVAVRRLARPDARVAGICGCGTQGRAQLRSVARVLELSRAYVFDTDRDAALRLAADLSAELALRIEVVDSAEDAISVCDICVTCTPARAPFVTARMLRPGSLVAAVGADAELKHELAPEVFAGALVVTDVTAQSATIGDLHHALDAGVLERAHVYAELGEIVAGLKPGRTSRDQIIIFDSTGMAIQDAAVAALVYERAEAGSQARACFDFAH